MGCWNSKAKDKNDIMSHMVRQRRQGACVEMFYETLHTIGHGSMGTVSRVRHLPTGSEYALKTIQLARISPKMVQEMRNEIDVLKRLDHPNIIRAIETFESKRRVYLVMELCTGGDLTRRGPYTETVAAHLILSAVSYMHDQGVSHRDLKLENVMYESHDPDAEIQVIDFGLSKIYLKHGKLMHEMVGTLYSMAPEVILGEYDESCDMWSVGVMAFILLSGDMPFDCTTQKRLLKSIEAGHYEFRGRRWKKISMEAR
ncbi:unnamed protein product [Discosporangium mesarthrocarpum]